MSEIGVHEVISPTLPTGVGTCSGTFAHGTSDIILTMQLYLVVTYLIKI